MNRGVRLLLVVAITVAVNVLLFGVSDLLTRERPLRQHTTVPVAVNLIQLEPPAPPEPQRRREPPKPLPKPRPDFKPELTPPSLVAPAMAGVQVDMQLDFAVGEVRGPIVFDGMDLDQPPRPLPRSHPIYPYRAKQRGIEGDVTVKVLVRADGTVGSIEIIQADPPGYFEENVIKAVEHWRFEPGRIAGEPVASWVVSHLEFQIEG